VPVCACAIAAALQQGQHGTKILVSGRVNRRTSRQTALRSLTSGRPKAEQQLSLGRPPPAKTTRARAWLAAQEDTVKPG
jgi:hypothetical protein